MEKYKESQKLFLESVKLKSENATTNKSEISTSVDSYTDLLRNSNRVKEAVKVEERAREIQSKSVNNKKP